MSEWDDPRAGMSVQEGNEHVIEFLRQRKKAYQLALTSPAGQEVLQDLMEFCRAKKPCFDPDPRIHAVLEGRREVWLRIEEHLERTSSELYRLYTGQALEPRKVEE